MMNTLYTPTTPEPAAVEILPQNDGGMVQATRQEITAGLMDRFTAYLDVKPKTVETYSKALRQFGSYMADRGITRPQREDIISFREHLKEDHSPATVQGYLIATRLFFRWTAQEGIYPNIADHVKGVKISKEHKKDYLTARQTKAIISGINAEDLKGLRDLAIFTLMVTAGLRDIEVVRADIQDLTVAGGDTVLYVQGKGKDQKADYVKVCEEAEKAIRSYLTARGQANKTDPLFISVSNRNTGGRMTTRSVSRVVKTCMQAAGYDSDRLTAHSLRHTAATLNLLNGGTVQETQQLLRHQNINTTMIYSHNLDRAKNNSEKRVAKAIFK